MLEFTVLNGVIFTFVVLALFYTFFSIIAREILRPEWKKLIYTVFLFSLFGVIGEAFVNTLYELVFGAPLWEYRIFPAHGGDITYFFPFIWGSLGFYTYWRNVVFRSSSQINPLWSGLILGVEAIFLELLINVPFYLLFEEYIWYYFPANLGPFSHFSCLQVVPFYMIVGHATSKLIQQQEAMQYRYFRTTLEFYLMIMVTFVYSDLFT